MKGANNIRYRTKSLEAEAYRNDLSVPIPSWLQENFGRLAKRFDDGVIIISTIDGVKHVDLGDYIMLTNKGIRVSPKDEFEAAYEPII